MKISVVVPSKGCTYLKYLLSALGRQSRGPDEVILVVKDCDVRDVDEMCRRHGLPCLLLEQTRGYVTHALNMGKRGARGDLVVFTDDDAIPPTNWLKRWQALCGTSGNLAGLSSRDIYIDLESMELRKTPDDQLLTKLYRLLVRPWREPPHPALRRYRLGVYLTKSLDVAYGPYIPSRECLSLPFRGVNMCFLASHVYGVWFPEDDRLKRGIGYEQYFGLELALKGLDTAYVPNNPVLHIAREESLSRTKDRRVVYEYRLIKAFMGDLLRRYGKA